MSAADEGGSFTDRELVIRKERARLERWERFFAAALAGGSGDDVSGADFVKWCGGVATTALHAFEERADRVASGGSVEAPPPPRVDPPPPCAKCKSTRHVTAACFWEPHDPTAEPAPVAGRMINRDTGAALDLSPEDVEALRRQGDEHAQALIDKLHPEGNTEPDGGT